MQTEMKSNTEKLEMLKSYYEQLTNGLRNVMAQLANPDLPTASKQALMQKQNELKHQLLQFHGKYLKPIRDSSQTQNSSATNYSRIPINSPSLPISASQHQSNHNSSPLTQTSTVSLNQFNSMNPVASNAFMQYSRQIVNPSLQMTERLISNTPKVMPKATLDTCMSELKDVTEDESKERLCIADLVLQVDPNLKIEYEAEQLLLEIADTFIESVSHFACALAKHRNSSKLEAKDVKLHLEHNWNIRIPGFSSHKLSNFKKNTSESHKSRLQQLKKFKPI